MRTKGLALTLAIAITVCFSTNVMASGNGLSIMEFLNIGVSARNAGTAEALAPLSEGAIAAYYNPAGLTMADNYQIAAMHSEWFQDLRYEYLGLAAPAGQRGNFGASFSYLTLGAIDGYSSSNISTGGISAYDWSFGLAYGHKISDAVSLGAGGKIINERLDNVTAFGYAGDIGAQYRSGRIGVGLALMNLGPNVEYEQAASPLPSRLETGLAWRPWDDRLAVLTGVGVPFRGEMTFKAGMEYTYAGALVVRGGYDSAKRFEDQDGFSMGAGFKFNRHSLDYAYNVNSVLGGTHQFSFVLRLGKPREDKFYSNLQEPPMSRLQETAGTTTLVEPVAGAASAKDTPVVDAIDDSAKAADNPIAQTAGTPAAPIAIMPVIPTAGKPATPMTGKSATPMAGKSLYLVCAGRYSSRADAEKHMDALEKFGYKSRIEMVGQDDFRLILTKESNRAKAEKKMKEFNSKGITCFIEEKK